jgi:hypothetical protein
MVIGGAMCQDGLLRGALKLGGQSAEVVMALGEVFPEPPFAVGVLGVVVVGEGANVVVVATLLDVFENKPPATAAAASTAAAIISGALKRLRRGFGLASAARCLAWAARFLARAVFFFATAILHLQATNLHHRGEQLHLGI